MRKLIQENRTRFVERYAMLAQVGSCFSVSHSNFSIADIPAYLVVAHLDLARDSLLRFGAVALS